MPETDQPIRLYLHAEAPDKPPEGAACNGCGICCAWAPCPVGILVSGRREGPCRALQWQATARHYRCGLLAEPQALWPWLPPWARRLLQALARRWIAAGAGCDCSLEARKEG